VLVELEQPASRKGARLMAKRWRRVFIGVLHYGRPEAALTGGERGPRRLTRDRMIAGAALFEM
jgi:hypothetical protein